MSFKLPTRSLVSQQDSAMIQRPDVPRSRFTGSWSRKTTFDAGLLVPFLVDEALPGDHLSYDITAYLRMATPLFPMFDNMRVDTFIFAVPNRLVWDNWERFMGSQDNPTDSIAYTVPVLTSPVGGFAVGSIYDHFGLPTVGVLAAAQQINVNSLPLRAYNLIYNQWFRDQNLIVSNVVRLTNTGDLVTDFALMRRAKSHDYFTSLLPWAQKFTAPTVPVGGQAWVKGIGITAYAGANAPVIDGATYTEAGSAVPRAYAFSGAMPGFNVEANIAGGYPNVYADLSTATGVNVNTLRQSFMVQQLLERDAMGGTRYTELMRAHFGVISPDARLQRPEYIGGGSTPLMITPIAQTAPSAGVPVGALGAAGTAAGAHRASYAATEHCYIIGLINVRSELSYQQGLWKLWSRSTRYDFYFPSLAGLGEQAVLVKEIYARGTAADNDVFGYQERWHEYRTRVSEVTGLFRSTSAGTIDQWHLAQRFTVQPVLGPAFIQDDPPMSRVLAATSTNQQFLADILIRRQAVRPIPLFGTPATLGRF